MPRISDLPPMTSPADDDQIAIVDDSTSSTKKITLTALVDWVQSKLEAVASWVSASMINFGGSGSGIWWEEIGRTTLGSTSTLITVDGFAAKKYLKILISAQAAGALNTQFFFNNDGSSLYRSSYISQSSGTNTDTGAITVVPTEVGSVTDTRGIFVSIEMYNPDNNTKYGNMQSTNEQSGSGVPAWMIEGFRYVKNTQVTRIDFQTTTGLFAAGSEVIVMGHN